MSGMINSILSTRQAGVTVCRVGNLRWSLRALSDFCSIKEDYGANCGQKIAEKM